MKKICKQCQKDYEAIRESSQYCSAKCRAASAYVSVEKELVSVENLSVEPLSVEKASVESSVEKHRLTKNGYYFGQVLTNRVFDGVKWPDRTVGICRACGIAIDQEANPLWDLLDKCPKCSTK
jgi:hypothetical protein